MKKGTPHHPKMRCLATTLKVPIPYAVGLMEMLWQHTGHATPRGDIGILSDLEIAGAVAWDKKPATLIEALVSCGWLDRDENHRLIVHDWPHHCDHYIAKVLRRKKIDFLKLYGVSVYESEDLSGQVQQKSDHSRVAEAKAEASSLTDTSTPEETSTRVRGDSELDLGDDIADFLKNSASRAHGPRIKTNTKAVSRTLDRLRDIEREYGRPTFRRGWIAFLAELPNLDVREPLAYFAASISRWVDEASTPPRDMESPVETPEFSAPSTAVVPIRTPMLDAQFQEFIRIAPEIGCRTVTKQEAEAAWNNGGKPYLEPFCWVNLRPEQIDGAIRHYRVYCKQRSSEPKFIKSPLNFLKSEPWDAIIVDTPAPANDKDDEFKRVMARRKAQYESEQLAKLQRSYPNHV